MNMMYELIIAQKKAKEAQAMSEIAGLKVKPKYEYDSDEDTTEGTWEHKKRMMEMNATKGRVSVLSPFSFLPSMQPDDTKVKVNLIQMEVKDTWME